METIQQKFYCNGNPIPFIDPSGLIITLSGTTDEMQKLFNQLRALTDDELGYDKDTGIVTITKSISDGKKVQGTKLVADMIGNNSFNTYVKRDYIENEGCYIDYNDGGAAILMNDWVEEGENWFYEVSNGRETTYDYHKDVAHIILGHELIHATHYMNETLADPSRVVYVSTSKGLVRDDRYDLNVSEKYDTVRVYYIVGHQTPDGSISIQEICYPMSDSLSENALREEQGLNKRVAY